MSITIETRNLTKRFGDLVAVDQLDLSINSGEIFGLLGPNAAGKSTTIRLLAGILRPSSGEANILGLDLISQAEVIKRHIGYVAQSFALYPDLTVYENITFYGGLYGINDNARFNELLSLYDLNPFRNKKSGLLSGGYKRRLAIACATAHDPELIFLDEPTAGIDPVTRKGLWDIFYSLSTNSVMQAAKIKVLVARPGQFSPCKLDATQILAEYLILGIHLLFYQIFCIRELWIVSLMINAGTGPCHKTVHRHLLC